MRAKPRDSCQLHHIGDQRLALPERPSRHRSVGQEPPMGGQMKHLRSVHGLDGGLDGAIAEEPLRAEQVGDGRALLACTCETVEPWAVILGLESARFKVARRAKVKVWVGYHDGSRLAPVLRRAETDDVAGGTQIADLEAVD